MLQLHCSKMEKLLSSALTGPFDGGMHNGIARLDSNRTMDNTFNPNPRCAQFYGRVGQFRQMERFWFLLYLDDATPCWGPDSRGTWHDLILPRGRPIRLMQRCGSDGLCRGGDDLTGRVKSAGICRCVCRQSAQFYRAARSSYWRGRL